MTNTKEKVIAFLEKVKDKKVTDTQAIWGLLGGYVVFDGTYEVVDNKQFKLNCKFTSNRPSALFLPGKLYWDIDIMPHVNGWIYFDTGKFIFDDNCLHEWQAVYLFRGVQFECKKCGKVVDKTGELV
jgi:hypothetical protein